MPCKRWGTYQSQTLMRDIQTAVTDCRASAYLPTCQVFRQPYVPFNCSYWCLAILLHTHFQIVSKFPLSDIDFNQLNFPNTKLFLQYKSTKWASSCHSYFILNITHSKDTLPASPVVSVPLCSDYWFYLNSYYLLVCLIPTYPYCKVSYTRTGALFTSSTFPMSWLYWAWNKAH